MKRREFITFLGGTAAAWPLAARAQQSSLPVVGFMNSGTPNGGKELQAAFGKGASEAGFIEGQNVTIEYHWGEGHDDRLAALAADLVRRRVNVIAATGTPAALAAKAATTTIPIVFETAGDPIKLGLIASLSRPGGNITGVSQLSSELVSKRLGLLHDLIPTATTVGFFVNPLDPRTESQTQDTEEAARALGLKIHVLEASTEAEIIAAFATLAELRVGALFGRHRRVGPQAVRTDPLAGRTAEDTGDLSVSRIRGGGWPDQLWNQHYGRLSSGRRLHRPRSQGREAR